MPQAVVEIVLVLVVVIGSCEKAEDENDDEDGPIPGFLRWLPEPQPH